jgi:hypothetical protein
MTFKEFVFWSKDLAKQSVVSYFEPLKVIIAFLAIPYEMIRQFVLHIIMTSEDFEKLQEMKFVEENAAMSASGLTAEEIEAELQKCEVTT